MKWEKRLIITLGFRFPAAGHQTGISPIFALRSGPPAAGMEYGLRVTNQVKEAVANK